MTALVTVSGPSPVDRLAAATEAFLAWHASRSKHTAAGYRRDLRLWLSWLADRGLDPLTVNRGGVMAWLAGMDDVAESTKARRLSAVTSWYQYLIGLDLTGANPAAAVPTRQRPKAQAGPARTLWLSETQTRQLLAAADADGPRTSALVALLVATGGRVGEVLSADVEDLTLLGGRPVLPVTGKGRRQRPLPLPAFAYNRVAAYLATRDDMDLLPAVAAGARPRRPLIATKTGRRVTRERVRLILRRLARTAGGDLSELADRIHPHVLRHTYATLNLAAGVDVRSVSRALGHARVETTERYAHDDMALDRHPTYLLAARISPRQQDAGPAGPAEDDPMADG